jgi:hypothetical protein
MIMQIFISITYISVSSESQDKFKKKFLILWGYGAEGVYHFREGLLEDFIYPFFIP